MYPHWHSRSHCDTTHVQLRLHFREFHVARGTKCSQKQTHILGNIYSICKANYKYSQLYPVNDWTTGSSMEMKAFKKWEKKKIKGKKKCLRTQKLQEKFLQSLLRNSIPNKTTQYIIKQKKKHRPKYILCLIKLCEMGNVLKPEFDQYT